MSTPSRSGGEVVRPHMVAEGAAPPPQKIVIEQPGGMFGRFGKLLFAALVVSLLFNFGQWNAYRSYFTDDPAIQEKYHSLEKLATTKVAVVELEGVILEGDGFVKRQIDQVRQDDNVKAVVLRINSPGGTVAGSDYLFHQFKELAEEKKIPLVVSMGSLCASGGYYVAMAVGDQQDAIFAEPATWTGSIGVIIPHYDLSGLLESWKIKDDSIKSHELKQLLTPTQSLSEEANPKKRQILQSLVDESFAAFKDIVRHGRPAFREDDAKLDEVATGQIFSAHQALKHELVDKIGFVEDAIDRAIELAVLDKDEVRVVKYQQPPGLLGALAGGQSRGGAAGGFDLATLLDLTAPKAYYLSTWLPAVLSNTRP